MGNKAKASTIILILLVLISLGLGGVIYTFWQKEQQKTTALQSELNDIKTRQKITENKLDESKKMIQDLENKLKDSSAQVDMLGKELQQEKAGKEEALSQMKQLKDDLDKQKLLRTDLEDRFTKAQGDVKKMQDQLNGLEARKAELETKIKELEEKSQNVELGKIVVSPEGQVGSSRAKEGKVLVINKDYNFAVINLGTRDGVAVGDTFYVYHGDKPIGEAKVEKIHDTMSAIGFAVTDTTIKESIAEGDKVIAKIK